MSDDWEQLQGALTKLDAAEAEVDRLREALRELLRYEPLHREGSLSKPAYDAARAVLSEPLDKEEG